MKNIAESQDSRILKARTLFVICTRVTTFHSCYMRMHSFTANQKRVIFSCERYIRLT